MDVASGTTLIVAILVTGAVLAIALSILSLRRWSRLSPSGEATPLSRTEQVVVSLVGSGALLAIPMALIALITSAVRFGTDPTIRVSGLLLGASAYPPFLRASDAPVDAGYESAWVEVANLPAGPRWMLWLEGALPALVALVIAVAVAWLALALLRGTPFTRAFPVVLGVVAIVIVGAGLGSQLAGAMARAEVVDFLGPAQEMTAHDDGNGPYEGFVAFGLTLDLSPLGWGLGIALLSAAFTIGTRMQHDTRGLV